MSSAKKRRDAAKSAQAALTADQRRMLAEHHMSRSEDDVPLVLLHKDVIAPQITIGDVTQPLPRHW